MPLPGDATAGPAIRQRKSAESAIERIGIIGLGHMGHAFAANLIEDGYNVLVHDRDPGRVADLVRIGAHPAEAERTAMPMPAASLVHDRLVAMTARGWTDLDWSALGLLAAVDAGLDDHR